MSLCPTFDKRLIKCPTNISCIYLKWNVNSFACLYHKTRKFIIIIIITATTAIIVIKVFKVSTHLIIVLEPRVLLKIFLTAPLPVRLSTRFLLWARDAVKRALIFFKFGFLGLISSFSSFFSGLCLFPRVLNQFSVIIGFFQQHQHSGLKEV